VNIILNSKFSRKTAFLIRHLRRYFRPKMVNQAFGHSADNKLIDTLLVINLDRQPDRWRQITNEARLQKVAGGGSLADYCYRVSAIDGKQLNTKSIPAQLVDSKFNIKDQYYVDPDPQLLKAIRDRDIWIDMSPEEIAVALSHISCWKKILDERRPFALIVEDDIFFEGSFAHKLNLLWKELPVTDCGLPDFDMLHLSYREVDWGAEKLYFSQHLTRPFKGLWWLSGYVLSYTGAKKLMGLLPVRGPVDLWMNLQFPKMNVYASVTSLIYQRNDLKSDNNYSIMPILSQIGIQSDKTHLELQQRKGRNPVFVVSTSRRTATTMETALSLLGYRCCFDKWGHLSENIENLIKAGEPLLFDAYIGLKYMNLNYQLLASMYPEAVFIVMIESDQTPENYRVFVTNEIIQEIRSFFKKDDRKLLIMKDQIAERWENLCKFLDCKIPPFGFPNVNSPDIYATPPSYINMGVKQNAIQLQHDVTPWIIPIERLSSFGISASFMQPGQQIGNFYKIFNDNFLDFKENRWRILDNSFPSNLAEFVRKNFKLTESGGFSLTLDKLKLKSRDYVSASLASKAQYSYGRFEVTMRPVKLDGVITAFFLHRNDPWQEIDFEILGKDTTKALVNVYFNPGNDGSGWNFGNRGTPALIDLGFDAAVDFHKYTIEWEPHEIRWLIDDELIHVRTSWQPTPIPDQPMNCFVNLWPSRSEELAGIFNDDTLPVHANIKSISTYSWTLDTLID